MFIDQTEVENKDSEIKVQNILTPNGDGINDLWIVKNIEQHPKNWVKVFSTTGKLVYSKVNYRNDWDGRYNGNPLSEGSYIFIIQTGPNLPLIKGTFLIINDK